FQSPSWRNSIGFAILYFLMFTNIYLPLSMITTYGIIIYSIYRVLIMWKQRKRATKTLQYLLIAAILAGGLCLPCLFYTLEVLQNINRGTPITGNAHFFNSNYVPPQGLLSIFLPLSSARMSFPNTEGTMFDAYMGLFVLLTVPLAWTNFARMKKWNVLTL